MRAPATFAEHDAEPVRGLPEPLPPGETLLWQGSPRWWSLARGAWLLNEGAAPLEALRGCVGPALFSLACLGVLCGIAALAARGTVYTVTTRRVVVRQGIALSSTLNLPFAVLRSADLRPRRDGSGDIALELLPDQRVSYLWMWPHVRPWRWTRPQPMLRNLPDAEAAGSLLARAFAAASGRGAVRVEPAPEFADGRAPEGGAHHGHAGAAPVAASAAGAAG